MTQIRTTFMAETTHSTFRFASTWARSSIAADSLTREVWLTLLKFSHKTCSGTKITYVGSGNDRWRLPVSWMKVLCASPSTQTPDPRPSLHFPLHLLKTPQTDAFTMQVHWNRVRLSLPPKDHCLFCFSFCHSESFSTFFVLFGFSF